MMTVALYRFECFDLNLEKLLNVFHGLKQSKMYKSCRVL